MLFHIEHSLEHEDGGFVLSLMHTAPNRSFWCQTDEDRDKIRRYTGKGTNAALEDGTFVQVDRISPLLIK